MGYRQYDEGAVRRVLALFNGANEVTLAAGEAEIAEHLMVEGYIAASPTPVRPSPVVEATTAHQYVSAGLTAAGATLLAKLEALTA